MKKYSIDELRTFFAERDRDALLLALTNRCPYHVEESCRVPALHHLRKVLPLRRQDTIEEMTSSEKGATLEQCIGCAFRWQSFF